MKLISTAFHLFCLATVPATLYANEEAETMEAEQQAALRGRELPGYYTGGGCEFVVCPIPAFFPSVAQDQAKWYGFNTGRNCNLASITSPKEQWKVEHLMTKAVESGFVGLTPDAFWIGGVWSGGFPLDDIDNWEWLDGRPFSYNNFAPNQPSATIGEVFLEIFYNEPNFGMFGTWNNEQSLQVANPSIFKCCPGSSFPH